MPPSGQSFVTLRDLQAGEHHNVWKQDDHDDRIQCVSTEPKVNRPSVTRKDMFMEAMLIWEVRDRSTGFLASDGKW